MNIKLMKLLAGSVLALFTSTASAVTVSGQTGAEITFFGFTGGGWSDGRHLVYEWDGSSISLFDTTTGPSFDFSFMLLSDPLDDPNQLYAATMEYYGFASLGCSEEVSVYGFPDAGPPCQGGGSVTGTNGSIALDSESGILSASYLYSEDRIFELDTLYNFSLISGVDLWYEDWDSIGIGGSVGMHFGGITPIGTTNVPEPTTMLLFGVGLIGLAGSIVRRKKSRARLSYGHYW